MSEEKIYGDAEQGIIALLLLYPDEGVNIFGELSTEKYFLNPACRVIWKAMLSLFEQHTPTTLIAVQGELKKQFTKVPDGVLKKLYESNMLELVPNPGTINHYIKQIKDAYFLTQYRARAQSVRNFDDVVQLSQHVINWSLKSGVPGEKAWPLVLDEFAEKQETIIKGERDLGYKTGLPPLDRYINLCPGKFYVIGGVKKGGKTLFLLSILYHNLMREEPVPTMLFSLEMSAEEIARRFIARHAGVNSSILLTKSADSSRTKILTATDALKPWPFTINDAPDLTSTEIITAARRWKYNNAVPDGEGIIGVDFLQLINQGDRKHVSEASAIKQIAYNLAKLAKELQTVVIALAQLRNEAEGQEPHIRYLEGSGGIGQAAEAILLLDLHSTRKERDVHAQAEPIDVWIARQRTGEGGRKIHLEAELGKMLFRERTVFPGQDEEPWPL
jgi:replicative DNA helicase